MEKIAIVYWSGTGNTERMCGLVKDGITSAGAEAIVYAADDFNKSKMSEYSKIAFGCPSMGDEVLEEDVFEPMFSSIESDLGGKKIALFGSYGWGDGEWMRLWTERCRSTGATLVSEGVIANESPNSQEAADCKNLGVKLAKA
ncbi:MAG: flavodoxin [Candidatus Methanoplasma sp.]|jgi:flavodoxin short chain|nr:flavodoxin [Candidatus Methanoplasma sp.]